MKSRLCFLATWAVQIEAESVLRKAHVLDRFRQEMWKKRNHFPLDTAALCYYVQPCCIRLQ